MTVLECYRFCGAARHRWVSYGDDCVRTAQHVEFDDRVPSEHNSDAGRDDDRDSEIAQHVIPRLRYVLATAVQWYRFLCNTWNGIVRIQPSVHGLFIVGASGGYLRFSHLPPSLLSAVTCRKTIKQPQKVTPYLAVVRHEPLDLAACLNARPLFVVPVPT